MPRKDALDRILQAVAKEYETQIEALSAVRDRVEKIVEDANARVAKLSERVHALILDARDDNGDVINTDIEEAIDFLESEGVEGMEEVTGVLDYLVEDIKAREAKMEALKKIAAVTPTDAFYQE